MTVYSSAASSSASRVGTAPADLNPEERVLGEWLEARGTPVRETYSR